MPFAGYEDFDECVLENSDKEDPEGYCARIHYEATGEWPGEKAAGQLNPHKLNDDIDMVKLSKSEEEKEKSLSKADSVEKLEFDATVDRSVQMVYKLDDDFFIWGPASVEIVDKENDKIRVEALEKALPQLLKRARLSYAHTDQIVGRILERFETKEPVEVVIDGDTYERKEFPTSVLDLDDGNPPAMFVAGEVYDDTEQAQSVRKKIENGVIDSYSISGEALVTQKKVDDGRVYDDILELDLSAVTLCEEGMNQGAKFARVNGDVEDFEVAEVQAKSFEVESGGVSDPQSLRQTAKSDTMTEENQEKGESEESSTEEPDFVKRDEIPDSPASEQFVKEQLEDNLDKTVDAVKEEVEKSLPDGDLATVGYIDETVEDMVEEKMEEFDKGDDEDYEEEEKEEMEEEEEEMEEEMEEESEPVPEGEDRDKAIDDGVREALKEELPDDVWKVVSEYIGDSKAQRKSKSRSERDSQDVEDEIEKKVQRILSGDDVNSPGIPTGQREEELDKTFDNDEQEELEDSPALNNFY